MLEESSKLGVTVWPTGAQRPLASNLNFTAGQTVPNAVVVKVGDNGKVSLFNSSGSTHLLADVSGYYAQGSGLVPVTPVRLVDSRDGTGSVTGPVSGRVDIDVAGRVGIPAQGVSSVVMNVTVTQPAGAGWATLWPAGTDRPTASNLNFRARQTVPNLVVAKLGDAGRVSFRATAAT